MKTVMLAIFVCLSSLVLTDATQFCHYKTPMENFNMDKFMGTWYWAIETPNVYSSRGDRCPVSVIHKRENGTIAYDLKYIYAGESSYSAKEGTLYRCSVSKTDGKLSLSMPTPHGYWDAKWWILDTDYENYAASYACWFAADGSYRSWAMGYCREKICPESHLQTIKSKLQEHGIDVNGLEDLHQADCPAL